MIKKHKTIIILSSILVILLVLLICVRITRKNNIDNLVQKKYFMENTLVRDFENSKNLDITKPVVVIYFANYCRTCIEMRPIFKSLKKDLAKDYNVVEIDIEDPSNYLLVRNNIHTIPSIYIFDSQIGNKIYISLSAVSSYEQLLAEFERYTRIRSFIDMEKAQKAHAELMNKYSKK